MELIIPKQSGLATLSDSPLRFKKSKIKIIQTVKVFTLDKIWKDNYGKIDFIKIDTEGWEHFVLKGAHEIIKKYRPYILMEFEEENIRQCGLTKEIIISFIKKLNYQIYYIREDILCFPNPVDKIVYLTFKIFCKDYVQFL